jgi:hypothetical protein
VIVHKDEKDAGTCVDFTVDGCRVQEKKTLGENGHQIHIRSISGLPYNPDEIDTLQISHKDKVHVIPMRKYDENGYIVSTLSEDDLMRTNYGVGQRWKEANANILCDLATDKGINKYVELCAKAKAIPPLSDQDFYKNMIEKNAAIFTSESNTNRLNKKKNRQNAKEKRDKADEAGPST